MHHKGVSSKKPGYFTDRLTVRGEGGVDPYSQPYPFFYDSPKGSFKRIFSLAQLAPLNRKSFCPKNLGGIGGGGPSTPAP